MTAPPDSFIPLVANAAAKGKGGEFRVLVAESPEKARSLRDLSPAVPAGPDERHPAATCEPRVTLQREGQSITGIQIHCSCGQIIDLQCAYSDGPSSAPG